MARFVPNPNFSLKDVINGAKGKFTCLQCGKKFTKAITKLPSGKQGVVCPKCGTTYEI